MENAPCANFLDEVFGLQFVNYSRFARFARVRDAVGLVGEQYDNFQQFPFYWLGLVEVLVGFALSSSKKNK